MTSSVGEIDQEEGVIDDHTTPSDHSTAAVFPDDNNVLYRDTSAPDGDEEQAESLLKPSKPRTKYGSKSRRASSIKQLLHDNLASVCLGVVFSTLLVLVCIIWATGGFHNGGASKPHVVTSAAYKHSGGPPTAPAIPASSNGGDGGGSPAKQRAEDATSPTMPVLTQDPLAPLPPQGTVPLPNVANLRSRTKVVLDDTHTDGAMDATEQQEDLRDRTQTHEVLKDSYAGYVMVNHMAGAHMFYWLAEARNGNKSAPVIVWLMGGPGAPSCVYMFQAMGPIDITYGPHGEFIQRKNLHSWNEKYAMLYLDEPVGTGFSFCKHASGMATTDEQAAGHVATAIPTILHMYGKRQNPLYIFGISYGGKMAPLVAETLMLVAEKDPNRYVNMQGVGIGNGWVDPISVANSYSDHYAARGWIDAAIADEVKQEEAKATKLLSAGKTCAAMRYFDDDGIILEKIGRASGIINWYDVRQAFHPNKYFSPVTAALHYVNHVRKLLPVGDRVYPTENGGMNFTVYDKLKCAISRSSKPQVDGLLRRGVRVLIYHGEDDGMIPLRSARTWVKSLRAHAAVAMQEQHQQPWKLQGRPVGYWRADPTNTMTEVLLLHAGHMAVKDQPMVAKAMVERWIGMVPKKAKLKADQGAEIDQGFE